MSNLNEMNDLALASGAEMSIEIPQPDAEPVATEQGIDPESVSVYASSINPASAHGDGNIAAFDVTFNVTCVMPDTGAAQTFMVVKRIGVDKMKMAHEAKANTPISIVEAKEPEKFAYSAERIKALAGLK